MLYRYLVYIIWYNGKWVYNIIMYYVAQTTRINGKTVIWRPPPPSTPTLFALGQPAGRALYAVGTTMNRFLERFLYQIYNNNNNNNDSNNSNIITLYYYYTEQSGWTNQRYTRTLDDIPMSIYILFDITYYRARTY